MMASSGFDSCSVLASSGVDSCSALASSGVDSCSVLASSGVDSCSVLSLEELYVAIPGLGGRSLEIIQIQLNKAE